MAIVDVAVKGSGATVYLDDAPRGNTPLTLSQVCEGTHTIEVRSSYGRYVRRITVKTDDKVTLEGAVKPAFGLVSVTGQAQNVRGGVDPRMVVERALADDGTVMMYAPSADTDRTGESSSNSCRPGGSRSIAPVGRSDRPARRLPPAARVSTSRTQLSRALEVQGVAGLAVTSPELDEMLLSLLAAGSAEPDVLAFKLSDAESMAAVRRALSTVVSALSPFGGPARDRRARHSRRDRRAMIEPSGRRRGRRARAGDMIMSANGQPGESVPISRAVLAALPERRQAVARRARRRRAAMRKADMTASLVPRALVVSIRPCSPTRRSSTCGSGSLRAMNTRDEPVVRLNLAIALMHARSVGAGARGARAGDAAGRGLVSRTAPSSICWGFATTRSDCPPTPHARGRSPPRTRPDCLLKTVRRSPTWRPAAWRRSSAAGGNGGPSTLTSRPSVSCVKQ